MVGFRVVFVQILRIKLVDDEQLLPCGPPYLGLFHAKQLSQVRSFFPFASGGTSGGAPAAGSSLCSNVATGKGALCWGCQTSRVSGPTYIDLCLIVTKVRLRLDKMNRKGTKQATSEHFEWSNASEGTVVKYHPLSPFPSSPKNTEQRRHSSQ